MGETYLSRNDAASARDVLQKAEALSSKIYGPDNYHRSDVWVALGRGECLLGNNAEAEKLLRQSLAMRSAIYKAPNIWLAEVQVALAEALEGQHKRDEAKVLADQAATALRTLNGGVAKQMLARAEAVIAAK